MSEPEVVAADATIGVFPWKRRRMPGRQITDHQASRCRLVPAPQCRTSAMLSLPPIASWSPESRPATASGAVARLPRSLRRPGARSRIRFRPTTERYNDWIWISSPYGSRPLIMEPVGPSETAAGFFIEKSRTTLPALDPPQTSGGKEYAMSLQNSFGNGR